MCLIGRKQYKFAKFLRQCQHELANILQTPTYAVFSGSFGNFDESSTVKVLEHKLRLLFEVLIENLDDRQQPYESAFPHTTMGFPRGIRV